MSSLSKNIFLNPWVGHNNLNTAVKSQEIGILLEFTEKATDVMACWGNQLKLTLYCRSQDSYVPNRAWKIGRVILTSLRARGTDDPSAKISILSKDEVVKTQANIKTLVTKGKDYIVSNIFICSREEKH